jgi:hypothetical protein
MTMSNDFYLNAAQQRAAELEMELSAAKTDLLTYRHNSDSGRQAKPSKGSRI